MIRQPIITIMGHVDHGKTSILDSIRGSAVARKEAGGITQAIGASIIPLGTIKSVCGSMLDALKLSLTIPGLLFIDTPGHAAFVNLRKRGGNLADIAILVVDISEGLKPQTIESIEVLKSYKTPFVIAANKIDTIGGWQTKKGPVLQEINSQSPAIVAEFEKKMYEIVGQIFEQGLQTERFDRVQDYAKEVAIVPISAKTKSGIPELLMTVTGLAQRFLEKKLETDITGPGKSAILEVKDVKGLGKAMDVIVHEGSIKVNDTVVIGTDSEPIVTQVKALLEPAPLQEMREKKSSFKGIKSVHASTGVRIVTKNMDGVIGGMPLLVANNNVEDYIREVKEQVEEVLIETSEKGIIVKADSLGSLEALSHLLQQQEIPIKKSAIGPITKKDFSDGEAIAEKDPLDAVILGFNIPSTESSKNVKVFTNTVIYKLIEEYQEWKKSTLENMQREAFEQIVKPCKIKVMKGYVFRQNNPAIVGVDVLEGTLTANTPLMNTEGKEITTTKGIQLEQKQVAKAEAGKQVAASLPNVTVGRQIKEDDTLYSSPSEEDFKKFKEFKQFLSDKEKDLLKEIASIKRKNNPVWGI